MPRPSKRLSRPAHVHSEDDRREMLAWLIQENGGVMEVEENSGIARNHLRRLVRGWDYARGKKAEDDARVEVSILDMTIETITALLNAFSLTDEQAWDLFAIPPELRDRWRSARPQDAAHTPPANIVKVSLREPLLGDVSIYLPDGFDLLIDDTRTSGDLLVVQLAGRHYVYRPEAVPPQGQVRGLFKGVCTTSASRI